MNYVVTLKTVPNQMIPIDSKEIQKIVGLSTLVNFSGIFFRSKKSRFNAFKDWIPIAAPLQVLFFLARSCNERLSKLLRF